MGTTGDKTIRSEPVCRDSPCSAESARYRVLIPDRVSLNGVEGFFQKVPVHSPIERTGFRFGNPDEMTGKADFRLV